MSSDRNSTKQANMEEITSQALGNPERKRIVFSIPRKAHHEVKFDLLLPPKNTVKNYVEQA